MSTFRNLIKTGREYLSDGKHGCNASQEVEWLLAWACGCKVDDLRLRLNEACSREVIDSFYAFLRRRGRGEPLQHILERVDFYGYELTVGPGVFIPRPETECLLDAALKTYSGHGMICDLCTGSGAVGIGMACETDNQVPIIGVELTTSAIPYARRNRDLNGAIAFHLIQADLFSAFSPDTRFSLITANPPYVSPAEYRQLPCDVRDYDPYTALVAEENGLSVCKKIIAEARRFLENSGWLLCEIGETQGKDVLRLLESSNYQDCRILKDLAGRDRIGAGRKGGDSVHKTIASSK